MLFINNLMKKKYGFKQGLFKPKNPHKYIGNPNNIVYRSSWELKFLRFLDNHPDVLSYASEEFFIPYLSPIDKRIHRYFPDMIVKKKNRSGIIEVMVVEIKPKVQTAPPVQKKRTTKKFINEAMTYVINEAKWKAAQEWCADRKYTFKILTEEDLF
jgi:hypothetical protein